MKIDLKKLQSYIDQKLIYSQVHNTLPLKVYKYTDTCSFQEKWDEITTQCRGIVLDNEGNIITNCIPKFFNIEQLKEPLPNLPYEVYSKLDGSLIHISHFKGERIISSSGSFNSEQALKAKQLLDTKYSNAIFDKEYTYVFEIIYPENKIVVDYGEEEQLILLAIRHTGTGNEVNIFTSDKPGEISMFPLASKWHQTIEDVLKKQKQDSFSNEEGVIIKYSNNFRVKIKYSEYVRLHKIISNVSEKMIWEYLKDEKEPEVLLKNIPDELYKWIEETQEKYITQYAEIESKAHLAYFELTKHMNLDKSKEVKKEFATNVFLKYKSLSSVLFSIFENKSYKKTIWSMLEPDKNNAKYMKTMNRQNNI